MKVVFMGTPDFAVPTLEKLHEKNYEIGYVLTQPDKARNRGKKVQFTPVKEKALEYGLTVLQPERVKGNEEILQTLKDYEPDLMVVAAYGQILPQSVLDIPKLGCVNVHASLLPRYRGAAPIQRSIMDGDEETGVTIMKVEEALDAGNMLAKASTATAGKTGGQLHDELAVIGANLLGDFLDTVQDGQLPEGEVQDESQVTYAGMIFKKDGKIDFSKSPQEIERLTRAMDPWPGAYADYNGQVMKIWESEVLEGECQKPYGTILNVSDDGISVSSGGGILRIKTIQMPGKKRVKVKDFIRGNKIEEGAVLK